MIDEKKLIEELEKLKQEVNMPVDIVWNNLLKVCIDTVNEQPKIATDTNVGSKRMPYSERLTKRINLGNGKSTIDFSDKRVAEFPDHQSGVRALFERLAYYEDLEEKGKLVLFPRYAYFIKDNKYYKGWVQEVVHCVCRKPLYDIRYDDYSLANYRGYLGNTVFLTKEEAKVALKKRRKDGD